MAIQSVQRAIKILTLFTPETPRLGITEISKLMNLPKPTIHGLVQTLIDEGFLIQDKETRKYSLGLKIYELGIFLSGTLKINQVGGGLAQRLAKETGCMVRLGLWDRDRMLITMNLFPATDDTYFFRQLGLGPQVPAYCSAVGKALLSAFSPEDLSDYLNRVKMKPFTTHTLTDPEVLRKNIAEAQTKGYAWECEEYLNGLACIATPIFDDSGHPVAAISISGAADFLNHPNLKELAEQLRATSAEISLGMGCPLPVIMGGQRL